MVHTPAHAHTQHTCGHTGKGEVNNLTATSLCPWLGPETRVDVIYTFLLPHALCVPFVLRQHSSTFLTDPVTLSWLQHYSDFPFLPVFIWRTCVFQGISSFDLNCKMYCYKFVRILSYCCFKSGGSGMMVFFTPGVGHFVFSVCLGQSC